MKFGGAICPLGACPNVNTDLVDPEGASGLRKFTFGGAFGILTDGILGAETEFAYIPGYFNRADARDAIVASKVLTWTGNILIALPAELSRDGLRPYVTGGAGLLRFTKSDLLGNVFAASSNEPTLVVGIGALGRLTDRTSARFDLRRFIGSDDEDLGYGVSLWRASAGITFRY